MRRARGANAFVLGALALAATSIFFSADRSPREFPVFAPGAPRCPIIVPAAASDAELAAAQLVRETFAAAAGRGVFPLVHEGGVGASRGIFIGETRRAAAHVASPPPRRPPFDDEYAVAVSRDAVVLRSARPAAIEQTAAWWLEERLGAHWFMPGPLGAEVPRRAELRLAPGEARWRPAFLSRDFGLRGADASGAWARANLLEARIEHNHSYWRIFTREDVAAKPQLLPQRGGAPLRIGDATGQRWQPNLAAPETVAHAAEFIIREFDAHPAQSTFSLSINDTHRFDESPATLARVAPLRYFRGSPDYTPLVFGFTNAVADRVRARHPDRWISAYAYDWAENAPDFRLAPNIVPFLTADRSQWFDPAYAAEDRALIARWVRSGAGLVGVYDYFYGAPFLVPRPTLYAVTQSIPWEFAAGVRVFNAEVYPNWGLDGPKLWLAAQLLARPTREPAALLDLYYREFWREAAAPMREFFELADAAWREQPPPAFWLKFYNDEHQALLFPAARREKMRAALAAAARLAVADPARARLAFVRDAFAVSDAFAEYCSARDHLVRLASVGSSDDEAIATALARETALVGEFLRLHSALRVRTPLAFGEANLALVLRNGPGALARLRLSRSAAGRALLARLHHEPLAPAEPELLVNPRWTDVAIRDVGGSTSFEWAGRPRLGEWRGYGEPAEHRAITWTDLGDGRRAVRFAGCKDDTLSQLIALDGATPLLTRVRVRAKVSPGCAVFLLLNFQDADGRLLDMPQICRLPAGAFDEWRELAVAQTAPPETRFVGVGFRVIDQAPGDYAEFVEGSLCRVEAPRE